jgi:hypothetical protein
MDIDVEAIAAAVTKRLELAKTEHGEAINGAMAQI